MDEDRTMQEITSTADSNSILTYTTTCSTKKDKDGNTIKGDDSQGTGLWQWIVSTEDYKVAAFTPHTVCRRGENAFIAPPCPYYACLDEECTKCNVMNKEGKVMHSTEEAGEIVTEETVEDVVLPTKEELDEAAKGGDE